MTDESAFTVLDAWPAEHVPGLPIRMRSVSNIEPHLEVRAVVDQTRRALVEDPTRDLVSTLRETGYRVATGGSWSIEWSALEMIAGRKRSAIERGGGRINGKAVRRLRLKYADLGIATLKANETLRRQSSYQRSINALAMEILRRARDVHPDDPILAERANYSSPVLRRIASVADSVTAGSDTDNAKSRAVDLLRPVAVAMGRAPKGESWTKPLDDSLANLSEAVAAGEPTVFDRAIQIAGIENIRLSLILRALPPSSTVADRVRMRISAKRSLRAQVKVAPAGPQLQA